MCACPLRYRGPMVWQNSAVARDPRRRGHRAASGGAPAAPPAAAPSLRRSLARAASSAGVVGVRCVSASCTGAALPGLPPSSMLVHEGRPPRATAEASEAIPWSEMALLPSERCSRLSRPGEG